MAGGGGLYLLIDDNESAPRYQLTFFLNYMYIYI